MVCCAGLGDSNAANHRIGEHRDRDRLGSVLGKTGWLCAGSRPGGWSWQIDPEERTHPHPPRALMIHNASHFNPSLEPTSTSKRSVVRRDTWLHRTARIANVHWAPIDDSVKQMMLSVDFDNLPRACNNGRFGSYAGRSFGSRLMTRPTPTLSTCSSPRPTTPTRTRAWTGAAKSTNKSPSSAAPPFLLPRGIAGRDRAVQVMGAHG